MGISASGVRLSASGRCSGGIGNVEIGLFAVVVDIMSDRDVLISSGLTFPSRTTVQDATPLHNHHARTNPNSISSPPSPTKRGPLVLIRLLTRPPRDRTDQIRLAWAECVLEKVSFSGYTCEALSLHRRLCQLLSAQRSWGDQRDECRYERK